MFKETIKRKEEKNLKGLKIEKGDEMRRAINRKGKVVIVCNVNRK